MTFDSRTPVERPSNRSCNHRLSRLVFTPSPHSHASAYCWRRVYLYAPRTRVAQRYQQITAVFVSSHSKVRNLFDGTKQRVYFGFSRGTASMNSALISTMHCYSNGSGTLGILPFVGAKKFLLLCKILYVLLLHLSSHCR